MKLQKKQGSVLPFPPLTKHRVMDKVEERSFPSGTGKHASPQILLFRTTDVSIS